MHVQARRPPVGGGRHDDDEDEIPGAKTQQPSLVQREEQARVQEGTEGSKVSVTSSCHTMIQPCEISVQYCTRNSSTPDSRSVADRLLVASPPPNFLKFSQLPAQKMSVVRLCLQRPTRTQLFQS